MTRHVLRVLAPAICAGVMIASPAFAQLTESELVMRLNRLENQVRQLTGQVEQLQYRNQQLEGQLAARGSQSAAPAQQRAAAPPPQQPYPPQAPQDSYPPGPPPQGGRRGDAFDPNQNPSAPGAPRTLGGGAVAS